MNQSNTGGTDRPDYNEQPLYAGGGTLKRWFNIAAFQYQTPGTFGNAGRNILRGPTTFNQDLSLFKNFNIFRERVSGQFRAEVFNVINNPNFAAPNATINGSSAGLITSTVGNPRNMQFALKINF